MKVWLLTVGEPLPIDAGQQRPHRSGIVADILTGRGHDVTWWTSTFNHSAKMFRFPKTTTIQVTPRLRLCCLHSRPYTRNIAFSRILANRDVAREFRQRVANEEPPDVILASYPIPELARAGAEYGLRHLVPTVVDIRDLWPDVWATTLPAWLSPAASIALLPFHLQSRTTLGAFNAIWGITDEIVNWGIARAGRKRGMRDLAFPLAYPQIQYSTAEIDDARKFWSLKQKALPSADLKLCFFGGISARARIDVMIDAIRLLPEQARQKIRLTICGTGDALEGLCRSAKDLPQVQFAGWVNGPQIQVLADDSHAGILPYPSDFDFERSIPNKVIEYLAHGLPVLASLHGPVAQLIGTEACGRISRETDPRDLAATIADLASSIAELDSMSANARRVFQDRFLASTVYDQLAEKLEGIAGKAKR